MELRHHACAPFLSYVTGFAKNRHVASYVQQAFFIISDYKITKSVIYNQNVLTRVEEYPSFRQDYHNILTFTHTRCRPKAAA